MALQCSWVLVSWVASLMITHGYLLTLSPPLLPRSFKMSPPTFNLPNLTPSVPLKHFPTPQKNFQMQNCPSVILNLFQDKAPLVMGFFLATAALMVRNGVVQVTWAFGLS